MTSRCGRRWDAGWFLAVVVSIWAVLGTTRLLRAEEDIGRADLVLSRPIRPVRLLAAQLVVVMAVVLAFGVTTALALEAQGIPVGGSLLLGAGLSGVALTFTGVAALAAQLLDLRRRAVSVALGVLGLAFVLRMYANTSDDGAWLLNLTPLGWLDRLRPFGDDRWIGLLPMLVVPALLAVLAARERALRDSGAARLAGREHRAPRLRLLGGPVAFGWGDASLPLLATLPVAVLFAGIGVLAFGAVPRLTVAVPVTLVVLAYVLELLGTVLSLPDWVLDLSPFRWLPRPPLEPWTAGPSLALCAIGVAAAAAGVALFSRRDLSPD